ncbi:MAG: hypothetical protein NC133_04755, partial [Prevotella sp.]|nr:hypothetical protein [Prevotella sp.]
MASFVSLLVKTSIVEKIGLPISDFFIWGDDWEYTSRIANHYTGYLVTSSVVTHHSPCNISVDIIKDSPNRVQRYVYAYRNESYLFNRLGVKGKIYYLLKKNYHRIKLLLSRDK